MPLVVLPILGGLGLGGWFGYKTVSNSQKILQVAGLAAVGYLAYRYAAK